MSCPSKKTDNENHQPRGQYARRRRTRRRNIPLAMTKKNEVHGSMSMEHRERTQTVWPFVFLNLEELYGNIEKVHLS